MIPDDTFQLESDLPFYWEWQASRDEDHHQPGAIEAWFEAGEPDVDY